MRIPKHAAVQNGSPDEHHHRRRRRGSACQAWIAGEGGTFLGLFGAHLFNDAIVLEMITISMAVYTLVRLQLEKARPGSSPIL